MFRRSDIEADDPGSDSIRLRGETVLRRSDTEAVIPGSDSIRLCVKSMPGRSDKFGAVREKASVGRLKSAMWEKDSDKPDKIPGKFEFLKSSFCLDSSPVGPGRSVRTDFRPEIRSDCLERTFRESDVADSGLNCDRTSRSRE